MLTLILFWLSQTWPVTLRIQEKLFSGCTVAPDSKETKLGISDQEASSPAGKNARVVLVPCLHMEVCSYSYFRCCGYLWVPWVSFVSTDDSIQDFISVIFPCEDKIHFSMTKYIWHLKLWQHYAWQVSLLKSYRFSYPWSCIFLEISAIIDPKNLRNRRFWVTQTSKDQLERVKLWFMSFWRLLSTVE